MVLDGYYYGFFAACGCRGFGLASRRRLGRAGAASGGPLPLVLPGPAASGSGRSGCRGFAWGWQGDRGFSGDGGRRWRIRISIFLSVFDVHVNRSPIAGVIRDIRYHKGRYLNAMNPASAEHNEQNAVTVEGDGQTVVFKQIAGLLARRIIFTKQVGDNLARGERVGLIKFGSRVDVLLDSSASVQIKVGDRVKGGASVLAYLKTERDRAGMGVKQAQKGAS